VRHTCGGLVEKVVRRSQSNDGDADAATWWHCECLMGDSSGNGTEWSACKPTLLSADLEGEQRFRLLRRWDIDPNRGCWPSGTQKLTRIVQRPVDASGTNNASRQTSSGTTYWPRIWTGKNNWPLQRLTKRNRRQDYAAKSKKKKKRSGRKDKKGMKLKKMTYKTEFYGKWHGSRENGKIGLREKGPKIRIKTKF